MSLVNSWINCDTSGQWNIIQCSKEMKRHVLLSHEKTCVCVFSCSVVSDSFQSHGLQAPLAMGFSRQKYWSELPFPSPRDLSFPEIKPESLMYPAFAGRFLTPKMHIAKWKKSMWKHYTVYGKSLNIPFNLLFNFNSISLV